MSDNITLPHRLKLLGGMMRPVAQSAREQIAAPVEPCVPVRSMREVAEDHVVRLPAMLRHIVDRIQELMDAVVSDEEASDSDVGRVVGHFEATLEELLSGYRDIGRLAVCETPTEIECRDLLAAVYLHSLQEVLAWLTNLVEAMSDPAAALRARGIRETGQIELSLPLTLTTAPELQQLGIWIQGQTDSTASRSQQAAKPRRGLGLWGTLAAALIGYEIAQSLFGDGHHRKHD